jgi:hypothetical protein
MSRIFDWNSLHEHMPLHEDKCAADAICVNLSVAYGRCPDDILYPLAYELEEIVRRKRLDT